MDPLYLTTFVGVLGATVGSATSFSTTFLAQRLQARDARHEGTRAEREALFRDFIGEASRLYGDALSHEKDEVSELVRLYAMASRMRLVTSSEVVDASEHAMDRIVETYLAPNRSLHELRDLARQGSVDFLSEFARACRQDLATLLAAQRC